MYLASNVLAGLTSRLSKGVTFLHEVFIIQSLTSLSILQSNAMVKYSHAKQKAIMHMIGKVLEKSCSESFGKNNIIPKVRVASSNERVVFCME